MAGKLASSVRGKRRSVGVNAEPNVIPFIDIMLVLLIIFMVAAPMPTVDIRVDLPSSNSIMNRQEGMRPTQVRIELEGSELQYYVDGARTTRQQLGQTVLERAIVNNPALPVDRIYTEAVIIFGADQEATYSSVVSTMGQLQAEGFAKVSLFSELAQI